MLLLKNMPADFPVEKYSETDFRNNNDTMVTYSDLIQFSIFIVALVGLCYEIFKGKRK